MLHIMRALFVEDAGFTFRNDIPEPSPSSDEALIRPRLVGISALDVEVSRGLFGLNGVPGHAFVGDVIAVQPPDAAARWEGKRVMASPIIACGSCDLCRGGLPNHCRNVRLIGMRGCNGALADALVVPVQNLCRVPEALDDDHAVFAHLVGSAMQVQRQIRVESKSYVTVLGDGVLGLITAQVLARRNVSVRVVGRFSEKLDLCEKWGIRHRHADDVGRRADQDVVIDCTGSPDGLELAMKLVRPRGTIVLKSLFSNETRRARGGGVELTPIVTSEIELVGSGFGPLPEAIGMLARDEIDITSLISRRCRLEDGQEIFRLAARPQALQVVVEITRSPAPSPRAKAVTLSPTPASTPPLQPPDNR